MKLGTAVTVPYFRNPVDLAMAFATISELMDGREISLGLGPGSRSILTHQVERVKPLTIMAELATALRTLFAGAPLQSQRDSRPRVLFSHERGAICPPLQDSGRRSAFITARGLLEPAVLDLIARHFDGSDPADALRHRRHGILARAS